MFHHYPVRLELAEAKKLAEERKREKAEDRLARQRVKEQIAKDRAEMELNSNRPVPTVPMEPPKEAAIKKEYTSCKIQVIHHLHRVHPSW